MSYSEVVNELQGDEMKGIRMLMSRIESQKITLQKIHTLNEQLQCENQAYNARMQEMKDICQHLKKQPPFIIVENGKVYQVNHDYQVQVSDADYLL
jgi:pantothenate kinase